ncbi:TPA: type VI secretion system tip protein VgrG [Providencia stuartii]|nr:type VI secretion system tip protein VgrG [Providencia stuartii]MBG5907750.1 type VI secretion system tip protein VgrG [Providencia stuartii]HAU5736257.1 type VI secretion system tip protein VgrG [Providencia stuartii]HAU5773818.1 type VI secretion system tip protein VgrG [Providencia stuartii]HEM6893647.1 type VI secretion system tip protein VgrG [Providencia stuartii]
MAQQLSAPFCKVKSMSSNISRKNVSDAEKAGQHWQSLLNRPEPQRLKSASDASGSQPSQSKKIDIYDAIANRKLYSGLVFTCQIGDLPVETFQVTQFDLHEGLSELFTLNIQAVSSQSEIDFQDVLGMASSITIMREGIVTRCVQGILASAEQGNTDGVKTWYQFVIRPEMWIMTLKQDSRIFQDMTVPQVLKMLLDESHVKHDKLFYHPEEHLQRSYITQKRETLYEFWCRLAAEEGINYWFEEGPQLFYSDRHLGMKAGIHLTYNPQSETDITDSTVTAWRYAERLCSDIRIDKDYNQLRPSYPLSHQVTGEVHQQHEVFESYGRFQEDAEGQSFNQIRYEQSQNNRQTGTANTNCIELAPGRIFSLSNHPSSRMNDSWQVITAHHHGVQPLADNSGGEGTQLSNTITFIPSTQEWRPPYRYKPTADGDELATVVGPPGEEIYTNSQGAVTVYFHWDRRGKPDHSASCWVRVAHGWNGDGFGFMSIPRIGQEVIVSYLDGDIDRPIITGCTYNGRNNPPLDLPKHKTRTTFRSKTHKGEGFNELRFEDSNGSEEIYLHAQRDNNIHINRNKTQYVGHDDSHTVANDRKHEVCHDEFIHIVNEQTVKVGVNQFEQIGKDRITRIDNSWKEVIHASHFQEVGENKQCDIQNDYKLTAAGGIHTHTKVHTLQASETVIIKGQAGSIQLDAQGVTITGNITLKGNVSVTGGAPESVASLEAVVNEGLPLAEDCRAKAMKKGIA